jgi:hypothetical protein
LALRGGQDTAGGEVLSKRSVDLARELLKQIVVAAATKFSMIERHGQDVLRRTMIAAVHAASVY